jgi:hypothetical protein
VAAVYAARLQGARERVGDIGSCVAWVATFALRAAADLEAERLWQTARLADYLLGRVAPAT